MRMSGMREGRGCKWRMIRSGHEKVCNGMANDFETVHPNACLGRDVAD